jgi:hypothetical protein
MKIYVASKARHHHWWSALRTAGVPVTASWIDWPHNIEGTEPTAGDWSAHWQGALTTLRLPTRCYSSTSKARQRAAGSSRPARRWRLASKCSSCPRIGGPSPITRAVECFRI